MSVMKSADGETFEDGADRGRILVGSEQTGGRYALMEWIVAPVPAETPLTFGPHRHEAFEETFYVLDGQLEFLSGDAVVSLGPGDFVRAPPGVRHGYANRSGAPVRLLVGFMPGGFEELFLKHRTDRTGPPPAESFPEEAARRFASAFEEG